MTLRAQHLSTTLTFALLVYSTSTLAGDLFDPVLLKALGKPINVVTGHASPCFRDFDGDGGRDLLVGEFGKVPFGAERLPGEMKAQAGRYVEGRVRVYRNISSDTAPEFENFKYLRAGKEDSFATIPVT